MELLSNSEIIEIIKIECNDCSEKFLESEITYIKFGGCEIALCDDCLCNYKRCNSCDKYFEKDEMKIYNNDYYCSDCFDESYFVCENCDDTFSNDDLRYSESRSESLCTTCYDRLVTTCYHCDCEINTDHGEYNNIDDNTYCQSCTEEFFWWCERCEEYHNDNYNCEHSTIHNHNFRPVPHFYKIKNEKLFLGIEIEVEGDQNYAETFEDSNYFYCKEDGSLNNGFEIVSHPISYEYILENKDIFKPIFNLAQKGCKSFDTSTCGIHIHISKNALSIFEKYKLLKFFLNNWDQIKTVSQRKQEQLEQWAGLDYNTVNECLKVTKFGNSRRYVCLNFQNRNTIECRIFRGTLNPKSFFKNIEFIVSLTEFIKITSHSKLYWDEYRKFVFSNHYKNLINFIQKKGL